MIKKKEKEFARIDMIGSVEFTVTFILIRP